MKCIRKQFELNFSTSSTNALRVLCEHNESSTSVYEWSTTALRVRRYKSRCSRCICGALRAPRMLYECFTNALRMFYESRSVLRVLYEYIESSTRVYEWSTNEEVFYECSTSALRVGCIQNVHKGQPHSPGDPRSFFRIILPAKMNHFPDHFRVKMKHSPDHFRAKMNNFPGGNDIGNIILANHFS